MNLLSLSQLLILAAIWGASFLFMRIAVPKLGPVLMIEYRVGLAALFLFAVALVSRRSLQLRLHWKHYLVLGLVNSALPFLLSILNATAPIWGALIGIVWSLKKLTLRTAGGLLLGIAGVYLLVGFDPVALDPQGLTAVFAALGAAFCYGVASNYAERATRVEPFTNAHGSLWAATLLILLLVPLFPATGPATASTWGAVLALGVLCTGGAYLLYFRLIADIGAAPALTVAYLIPVFGILWGTLFLDEQIGWHTLLGTLVVLSGTALVTGFSPRRLFNAADKA